MDIADVEDLLRDQAFRTRSRYPIEFALDITEVLFTDDIGAFKCRPSRRTTQVRYEADSQSSPINLSNNQLPGAPQPLNNQYQTNLYQKPSNQPPQTNNQSHLGESSRNHPQTQRTSHGLLNFDTFMVTNLSDLEAHNPNSPTNDSLCETNYIADIDDKIDSSNAALNTTMQQVSNQATNNQHQLWDPPKGSNVKLVELKEGLCGLTNAELVFMDWETSYSSYQRAVKGEF